MIPCSSSHLILFFHIIGIIIFFFSLLYSQNKMNQSAVGSSNLFLPPRRRAQFSFGSSVYPPAPIIPATSFHFISNFLWFLAETIWTMDQFTLGPLIAQQRRRGKRKSLTVTVSNSSIFGELRERYSDFLRFLHSAKVSAVLIKLLRTHIGLLKCYDFRQTQHLNAAEIRKNQDCLLPEHS